MILKATSCALVALSALASSFGAVYASSTTLPSGAKVVAGQVTISSLGTDGLEINQSSKNAIINWSSFSIGSSAFVQVNNGSGATLNRVTGSEVSRIDGALNAFGGSFYIINPNGVIIGKDGQINVGGSFVASTLGLKDDDFSHDRKTFSGSSDAAVINLGSISVLGGDVVLIGHNVRNHGSIVAPFGDIGLLAGSDVVLRDMASNDGKFSVKIGGPGTSVVNSGGLQAAIIELRANQGNIYAFAGNTTGIINATGVSTNDGKVFLVAEGGHVLADGSITATKSDGSAGTIKVVGHVVGGKGANCAAQSRGRDGAIGPVALCR